MSRNWRWRAGIALFGVLLAVYLLIPTYLNFNSLRQSAQERGLALPWYVKIFPEKQVKLGLDLQGGIHLVLGVDVNKYIEERLNILASDLRSEFKTKNYPSQEVTVSKPNQTIHVVFAADQKDNPIDGKRFSDIRAEMRQHYPQLHIIPDAQGYGISLTFSREELRYLQKNAIDQGLQVLRNRIDEFGVNEPNISAQGIDRILVQLPGIKDPERAKNLIGRTAQLSFKIVDDRTPILDPLLTDKSKIPEGVIVDYERVQTRDGEALERPFLRGDNREQLLKFLEGKIPETHAVNLEEKIDRQTLNKTYRTFVLHAETLLTGDMLQDARTQIDPQWNRPQVGIQFDARGSEKFKNVTTDHVKERLAIVLDDNVNSAPVIQEPIAGGRASISFGDFGDASELSRQAQDLAIVLRAGSLKAPIEILEERTIGPTLGADHIRRSTMAMIVGVIAVVIFMGIYYKKAGWIANFALILNAVFILACLVLFQATLTLPGIAGLILTLGMAIDANVIINERIRDELRAGKDVRTAVAAGYDRAWWTVFDANITTAVAGFVLMQYGTGPIRGFAVTLLIGLLFSFITAVYYTRVVFDWWVERKELKTLSI